MKKYQGFTLAEVLITLAIIGVVAAMTVPALMTSTRGKEFEVGANKALSTVANAITMRLALEGTAVANFPGSIGQFLLMPPGQYSGNIRQGEQPALPTTFIGTARNTSWTVTNAGSPALQATLKDGMIVALPAGATNAVGAALNAVASQQAPVGVCGDYTNGCVIMIDTNGVKGPTRTANGQIPTAAMPAATLASFNAEAVADNVVVPTNVAPDVVTLRIRDTVVEPWGQRTKNILATGDAKIAQ